MWLPPSHASPTTRRSPANRVGTSIWSVCRPSGWPELFTSDRYAHVMSQPTAWEYATVPLLTHATKQILDQWGADGWELVAVLPGPTGEQHVAYLKRPK